MRLSALVTDPQVVSLVTEQYLSQDENASDPEITNITQSTAEVAPGSLFVCVRGTKVDGHDLAVDAVARGAAALVVEHLVDVDTKIAQISVTDARAAVGPFASALHGNPSARLTLIGITGTNGKTTVAQMITHLLHELGLNPLVLGTLSGGLTTPDAATLQAKFDEHASAVENPAVVMEVSSHAMVQHRVDGSEFRIVAFTNLSQDHLDFHKTMEEYFIAKRSLFAPEYAQEGVVFVDTAVDKATGDWGSRLLAESKIPVTAVTFDDAADLEVGSTGSRFVWRHEKVELNLGGRFNVANALVAATICEQLGYSPADIAMGLRSMRPVRGRFEPVLGGQDFAVLVDYAHTPDGLVNVLGAARDLATPLNSRVILVFGCGGDRDQGKRPQMGEIAVSLANVSILTTDNPRSEDPLEIIEQVKAGALEAAVPFGELVIEPDRAAAIEVAIREAQTGDVVVIAGKGHETQQIVGDTAVDFDDFAVASAALAAVSMASRGEHQ